MRRKAEPNVIDMRLVATTELTAAYRPRSGAHLIQSAASLLHTRSHSVQP